MRPSYKTHLLRNSGGTAVGFFAEADFTAEHARGLGELHSDLGCGSDDVIGVARYQPSAGKARSDDIFALRPHRCWTRPQGGRMKSSDRPILVGVDDGMHEIDGYYRETVEAETQYSHRNFVILPVSDDAVALASLMAERAKIGDVAVFNGGFGRNPFSRSGLTVIIPSLCDETDISTIRETHEAEALKASAPR